MSEGITANQLEPGVVTVFSHPVTLTDAQFKAAPTSPPTVVPGVEGQLIVPISIIVIKNFVAGYQTAEGDNFLYAFFGTSAIPFDTVIATPLLLDQDDRKFILGGLGAKVPDQSGTLNGFLAAGHFQGGEGLPLRFEIFTELAQNLVGGDPANTLEIRTAYMLQ